MKKRFLIRYLLEAVLAIEATYLLGIALKYSQERRDALVLAFMCIVGAFCLGTVARLKKGLRVVFRFCMMFGIVVLTVCEFCIVLGAEKGISIGSGEVDYILVLGNKLEDGELSNTLKARLDKAVEYSKKMDVPIIVTGGNPQKNEPTEASLMRDYLREQGVKNNILVEEKASDTRQNFLYTAELVGKDVELLVITSEVHLFRAEMLARDIGFQNVYGICSSTDKELYLYYNLREVVSILRDAVISMVSQL